jgi:hypothetical protein
MRVKTSVKAGGLNMNHNEALVRAEHNTSPAAAGLKVKTAVKGGVLSANHNQRQVRIARKRQG